ncbi:hypothetical protein BDV18DRAFT_142532 [Aspergillus unguis]
METRSRRKRCNSSVSNNENSPVRPKSCRSVEGPVQYETPRPRKKVRFSDPGPATQNVPDYSTGLTPALCRTSFEEREHVGQCTPTRTSRRRSNPLPRTRRVTDSPMPRGSTSPERVLHFTPLRQLLDTRTQRRIRRIGLSDEITSLEREKRAAVQHERSLESLLRERDSLRKELEVAKKDKSSPTSQLSDGGEWMAARDQIEHLESSNDRMRAQLSFSDNCRQLTPADSDTGTVDTILLNDSGFEGETMLISNSPDLRAADMDRPISDDFSLMQKNSEVDASVQTSHDMESELALSRDLQAAEKAKRDLFEACRARINLLEGTPLERYLRERSPPPDFLDDILPSLMQTLSRASNATHTLRYIHSELSSLGFQGENASESIDELRGQFRAARLELERQVPGETADVGLHDGLATLSALVMRVEALVKEIGEERTRQEGSADRERALRGQFDTLLVRYESSSKKIQDLEESIASSAGDMLHTRMRMQELERETQEKDVGIDRLNAALSKYHDEVKDLENLVIRLEDEKVQRAEGHAQQLSELKQKATDEEEGRRAAQSAIDRLEEHIRKLEGTLEQNRIRACDLTAKVEAIERERNQAVEILKENAAQHDQELSLMNVRVADLNTALEAAKAETEKLSRTNAGLGEQLRLEVEAKDSLLDQWLAEQTRAYTTMKAAVNTERRKSKVRTANWELKSDELQSTPDGMGMNIGSEPITPVSMTRFVDVEVGRGKHRRRLDSGIGVLTEEDEDGLEHDVNVDVVPSDPVDL